MQARLRKLLSDLRDAFWLIPGLIVLAAIVGAYGLIEIDRSGLLSRRFIAARWLYSGGATGGRTLLGAVASSAIGVAGTVFTITIAALSLAANQMGPRLLRNFTRDRGNQFSLGIFLGTFAYCLMVLRTIRTPGEGDFVPELALSVGIVLAFANVATLVYFVGHMAGRINVDAVIQIVADDLRTTLRRASSEDPKAGVPPDVAWDGAQSIVLHERGYLQHLDREGLADWASEHATVIRLLVRPGDFIFPGAPAAVMTVPVEGADEALTSAMAVGLQRISDDDPEYAVRQLVEVAVRALSPSINDPNTANNVLDWLGATLCELESRHLDNGAVLRHGKVVLSVPSVDYDGLTDAMFHMIRQNASGKPAVLIRLVEVLTAVVTCENDEDRRMTLERQVSLIMVDAERDIPDSSDLDDLRQRHRAFAAALQIKSRRLNGSIASREAKSEERAEAFRRGTRSS